MKNIDLINQKKEEIAKLKETSELEYKRYLENEKKIAKLKEELLELTTDSFNIIGNCYKYENSHTSNGSTTVLYIKINKKCDDYDFDWRCEKMLYRYDSNYKITEIRYRYDSRVTIYPDLTSDACYFENEVIKEVSMDEFEHVKLYFISSNPPRTKDDVLL